MVKVSRLLKNKIEPFLYGIIFGKIDPRGDDIIHDEFYLYTHFRKSTLFNDKEISLTDNVPKLIKKYNEESGYNNWVVNRSSDKITELRFYIENDKNITSTQFLHLIRGKLSKEDWYWDTKMNENMKSFIRGFMEPRGSVDTTSYFTQDYFYYNNTELKRVNLLSDKFYFPIHYMNLNIREYQPQYKEIKRNTQFRVNKYYYAKNIGFINDYKAKLFEKTIGYKPDNHKIGNITYYNVALPKVKRNVKFSKHLNFYSNYIYEKKMTDNVVRELRRDLGISDGSAQYNRNRKIIEIFDIVTEDKCSICKTEKTYKKNSGKKQAFVIHHVIPISHGKEFDNIANLVKLCETCHGSMKKGRADNQTQVENNLRIITNNPMVYEYVSNILGVFDYIELSKKLTKLLK